MNKIINNSYTSQDIETLDGIQAIRLRPGMYIGSVDQDGLHHLFLEVVSNSIDEFLNGHGTEIHINVAEDKKSISVRDNGRGIPFGKTKKGQEAMIELCTSMHSGGKFGQGGYSVSGGLHGIGLTAVNAVSDNFEIISSRDGSVAKLVSSRGTVKTFEVEKANSPRGTTVSFSQDPEIFGSNKFDLARIEETIEELSFLTAGLVFFVNGKKFHSKDGLKDMIRGIAKDPITDVVSFSGEEEGFMVEVALQFVDSSSERIYAFTNNIPNPEGGTHVTGFKTAFTNTINKLAKSMGLIEGKEENLNGDMVRRGLIAIVSLKMNQAPVFQGQTKQKLMTPEARTVTGRVVTAVLEKQMSKKDVKTIIDRALVEQKAEDAAKRAREAAKKIASGGKNMNSLKDLPVNLTDCTDRVNGEVWIVEGNSAGGSAKDCRDTKTQAILPLRGKVLNTQGRELADIIKNKEIKDIITTLGTGINEQFKLSNLRYDKIIILADAK